MIKNYIAACLALCASSAFAAPLSCDTSNSLAMVNTCSPEIKLYITGSPLGDAVKTVVETELFNETTVPLIKINDMGSANGGRAGGTNAVRAWYGMSKRSNFRLFVVYENNDSGAAVSQMLSKLGTVPESDVVTIGPTKNVANNCAADVTSTPPTPVINCTSHAPTPADLVISDLRPSDLYKLETPSSGKLSALSALTITPLNLQGFGVAVNSNLYSALQTSNLAEGLLPNTCTAGDATAVCQPNIRSSDYTSLVTKSGIIKSAAALLHNTDAIQLILARGSDTSGIQTASNIFFAANPCRDAVDSSGKAIKGVLGGALDIASTTDSTSAFAVQVKTSINDVILALNATSGYAIGVLGLGTVPGTGDTWKFVKIDGVSPNFNADGSPAYRQRQAFINGDYGFAMISYAVAPTLSKINAKMHAVNNATINGMYPVTDVILGLQDSTRHDLPGIGYLDGAADVSGAPKQSHVIRSNGNNCSPLITINGVKASAPPVTLPSGYVFQNGVIWHEATYPVSGIQFPNWSQTSAYCAGATFLNLTGWRLPTRAELIDLAISGDGSVYYNESAFWSSTPSGTGGHFVLTLRYVPGDQFNDSWLQDTDSIFGQYNALCVR